MIEIGLINTDSSILRARGILSCRMKGLARLIYGDRIDLVPLIKRRHKENRRERSVFAHALFSFEVALGDVKDQDTSDDHDEFGYKAK